MDERVGGHRDTTSKSKSRAQQKNTSTFGSITSCTGRGAGRQLDYRGQPDRPQRGCTRGCTRGDSRDASHHIIYVSLRPPIQIEIGSLRNTRLLWCDQDKVLSEVPVVICGRERGGYSSEARYCPQSHAARGQTGTKLMMRGGHGQWRSHKFRQA